MWLRCLKSRYQRRGILAGDCWCKRLYHAIALEIDQEEEVQYPWSAMSTPKLMTFSIALPKRSAESAPVSRNRKVASAAKEVTPVVIDSDFPDAAEMSVIRKLRVPKLKKVTTSLF